VKKVGKYGAVAGMDGEQVELFWDEVSGTKDQGKEGEWLRSRGRRRGCAAAVWSGELAAVIGVPLLSTSITTASRFLPLADGLGSEPLRKLAGDVDRERQLDVARHYRDPSFPERWSWLSA
jgi:hypothetical protein